MPPVKSPVMPLFRSREKEREREGRKGLFFHPSDYLMAPLPPLSPRHNFLQRFASCYLRHARPSSSSSGGGGRRRRTDGPAARRRLWRRPQPPRPAFAIASLPSFFLLLSCLGPLSSFYPQTKNKSQRKKGGGGGERGGLGGGEPGGKLRRSYFGKKSGHE